jgi:hypothetical protein
MVVAISGINIGLTIFGAVDPRLENKIYPSGVNKDYGYWRSYRDDQLTSGSGLFNQMMFKFEESGVKTVTPIFTGGDTIQPETFNRTTKTKHVTTGAASWQKAGDLVNEFGSQSIQERCIYFNKNDYLDAGSGIALGYTTQYSVYAKVIPSGNIAGQRIISKHKQNPAQMVLGIDNDGLYYVRSDSEDSTYYAKSLKEFSEYSYPTQVVGVFGYSSTGSGTTRENSLAIYVNGKLEDTSARFTRSSPEDRRGDGVFIGGTEFAGSEGFRGWIDEVGVSNYPVSPSSVKQLHDNTFNLSEFVNESIGPSGGEYDFNFGPAFSAMDTNYIEWAIGSGDPAGGVGGVFDRELWGNGHYAASSTLQLSLDSIRPDAYQITNNVYLDMWVKQDTNHWSGAWLQPTLNKGAEEDTFYGNLNWSSPAVFIPSSDKAFQNIRFSGTLDQEVYHSDGKREFKSDFAVHKLGIHVSYPSGTSAATTDEFRRNKPFQSSFRVYSTKLNVDAFVIPSTGIEDVDLYTVGDTVSSKSGILDLYIDAKNIVGNIDLYIQHKSTNLAGSGVLSFAPNIETTKTATFFTQAGLSENIKTNSLNLYLGENSYWKTIGPSGINLFLEPSQLGTSGIFKLIDLFMDVADPVPVASGTFDASTTMNLYYEGAVRASKSTAMNLYTLPTTRETAGASAASSDIELVLYNAWKAKSTDIPLFTKSPDSTPFSGVMNLSLYQNNGKIARTELFVQGPSPTGTMPMFVEGAAVWPSSIGDGLIPRSSGITLYMASGLGSATNSTTTFVTKGMFS